MKHRNEIDGLRAIAVLPVIFFHAEFPGFGGGFVGVDVFFVISGFLITRILHDEIRQGQFSLVSFYERRARRILPALFVVMAATLAIAWFVLLPLDFTEMAKSVWSVVLFLSNVLFWMDSGYWSTEAQLLPLLHTWSLAIEEQFYVLFPLLLLLLARTPRHNIKAIRWGIAALLLASFAAAEWMSRTNPDAAFFLLPFRGWELLVGSLLALYQPDNRHIPSSKRIGEVGAATGLALILFAVTSFDRTTPFPGVYALAPTLGAALIIAFARPDTVVGKLLCSRPLVGIGLISYSAYLWHHPLFALARHNSLADLSPWTYAGLTAATLVLAYASWRFVETPFRNKAIIGRKAVFRSAGLATLVFVATAAIVYQNKGFEQRIDNYEKVAALFPWQHANLPCGSVDLTLIEGIKALCSMDPQIADAARAPLDVALFGDSHADALLPAVVAMSRSANLTHAYIGLGGCVPLLGIDIKAGVWPSDVCRNLATMQFETAKKHRARTVLLVARWGMYIGNDPPRNASRRYYLVESDTDPQNMAHTRALFVRALERTVRAYENIGARVFLVEEVPLQHSVPAKVYHQINRFGLLGSEDATVVLQRHSVTHADHQRHQSDVRAMIAKADLPSLSIIRPSEFYCREGRCLLGDKFAPYYFDKNHIGVKGAELAAPWLLGKITAPL